MTVEEAAKELDIIKHCEVDSRKQIEAIDIAVAALQKEKIGTPLTLEQLRGMRGQPVWCEWILPEDKNVENGKWFIVIVGDKTGLEIKRPADYGDYFLKTEDYGKTWLAYSYPPVHIDREAWGPCLSCCCDIDRESKHCAECRYFDTGVKMEPCKSCKDGSNWKYKFKFCPDCGKPQEDEDWDELEKRLKG